MTARRIVITGAGKGLGRAMACGFARRGHTVLACGRSPETIASLASELGTAHHCDVVDVAQEQQVALWAEKLLSAGDPPDLLINNAAVINRNALLWEITAEEFDAVIDINIKGIANVIRHFLPAMVARGRGVVVNFSSGWGRSTSPEVAPYCTRSGPWKV